MAVTASAYGQAIMSLGLGRFNFGSDTLKVLLTTSSYTPNIDTHTYLSDVTNEVSGTGYTAGGATLSGVSWTYDATNNLGKLLASTTTWTAATFTARTAVVYKSTGTAGTSPLLSYVDFGADQSPAGVDFSIPWSTTDGVFQGSVL
jgi:hypothetical protein